MKIDFEYFNKEVSKFYEIMGTRQYSIEQCSDALRGLLTVYMNTEFQTKDEEKRAEHTMKMVTTEHDRRLLLRIQYSI